MNNNFILTGIPRAGTSLFCKILNNIDNIVCFNEIPAFYNLMILPGVFHEMRERLYEGKEVPHRFNKKGQLTSNTMKDGQDIKMIIEDKVKNYEFENIIIGSKINAPYLLQLDSLVYNQYKICVIVRHPVYVLGSYQMEWTKTLNIANCTTDKRYKDFPFKEPENKIACQAQLWNWFAKKILKYKNKICILKYEDIINDPISEILKFAKYMDKNFTINLKEEKLVSSNKDNRYKNIPEIKKQVEKYCTLMDKFEYEL